MSKKRNKQGWNILNQRNSIVITKLIGKIKLSISRGDYLGKQKIRLSSKVINQAFDLLDSKAQRIRKGGLNSSQP